MSMAAPSEEPRDVQQAVGAAATPVATASNPLEQVKELFEEYRRQGVPPNEAALKAMADVKARAGGVAAPQATENPTPTSASEHKELVKELFENYRREGKAPNEAAALALREANARLGR